MTLYFQTQFNRVICTLHARKIIRNSIKNKKTNSAMKMKYHDNPEPGIEYKNRNIKKTLNWKQNIRVRKTRGRKTFLIKLKTSITK